MYVFQFQDATFRIDRLTNCSRPYPCGLALRLFDGVYDTRASAEAALTMIERGFGL